MLLLHSFLIEEICSETFKVPFPIALAVECNVNGVKGYKNQDQNRFEVIITQSFLHCLIANAEDWEKEEKEIYQEINLFNRNQHRSFKKSTTK